MEIEPNEGDKWSRWNDKFKTYVELEPQQIPVVINGQIKPGDIDRFYFEAKKGQRVVFEVQSRSTAPFIANAVPGWFTAVVSLFDPNGKKIGYCESWRFDQNPMMFLVLPEDGKYMLEVQDSIYRGRNDFVYRLSVGEFATVLSQFPLGGKVNETTAINLSGENLPVKTVSPDFKGDVFYEEVRELDMLGKTPLVRPIYYVVETLPVYLDPVQTHGAGGYAADAAPVKQTAKPVETKPADVKKEAPKNTTASQNTTAPKKEAAKPRQVAAAPSRPQARKVSFPIVIYGRIEKEMQTNAYKFEGKKGQKVALDVKAHEIGSALDAAVMLLDPDGKMIASNDDRADCNGPNIGEEVIHSDPNLVCELPKDGTYTAKIFSTLRRGGPEYFYRLRISAPQPDFDVCVIPSRLRFNGKNASFKVKVFRKEGFDGEIQLRCIGKCSEMTLSRNGKIKPGENDISFSIASPKPLEGTITEIEMVGQAVFGAKTLSHKVLPVDDWEQAFIYHHLVPMKKFMASKR